MMHPLFPPPPPFSKQPRVSDSCPAALINEGRYSLHGDVCSARTVTAAPAAGGVGPPTPPSYGCIAPRRLFNDPSGFDPDGANNPQLGPEPSYLVRRRTTDGRLSDALDESISLPAQLHLPFGAGSSSFSSLEPYQDGVMQRRLSMPGTGMGPGSGCSASGVALSSGISFTFPAMAPSGAASTISGAPATPHRASRLALSTSATLYGSDDLAGAAASPMTPTARHGHSRSQLSTASGHHLHPHHHHLHLHPSAHQHRHISSQHSIAGLAPWRKYGSRATTPGQTPLQSGYPTPRTSLSGSVAGAASGQEALASLTALCSTPGKARDLGRMLSGEEKGLDTPVWVARLRLVGRLLLAGLFANLLLLEMREWRAAQGYGWREWYDLSWMSEEMPPLPTLLSLVALAALLSGLSTSLAASYLALRLLLQSVETWEEIMAVLREETSNLLPVKELAVVGTVIVFVGHTYYMPEWLCPGRRANGRATGLMYTQQWRPGQSLILLLGQLLVAPLFVSICALEYYGLCGGAEGLSGWRQRLLHPYYWLPTGDSSVNNWLPAQALTYLLVVVGIGARRVPAVVLAALLAAEAFTCWRFWSAAWMSTHYAWYLRRHFTANLAIAGGLLLGLPVGKHDARGPLREAKLGKKRA